jgi:transcriptional regulator with XRE-family HTH domain
MTERVRGQRLLLAVVSLSSGTEVAARVRVSKSNVSRWVSGEQLPSHEHRLQLFLTYRIPVTSWLQTDAREHY